MAKQLVPANVEINETAGLCLQFARRVFGLKAVEPTAHAAILNLKYLHKDRNFPAGVSFPVWFEWWGQLPGDTKKIQYDHAAVMHADGKVWSSPLSGRGRAWFNSVDDLVRAFGGGMKYIGWSEDISGTRVIDAEGDKRMKEDTVRYAILGVTGGQPMSNYEQEVRYWIGRDEVEFGRYLYGLGDQYALALRKQVKKLEDKIKELESRPQEFVKVGDLYVKK